MPAHMLIGAAICLVAKTVFESAAHRDFSTFIAWVVGLLFVAVVLKNHGSRLITRAKKARREQESAAIRSIAEGALCVAIRRPLKTTGVIREVTIGGRG